MDLHVAKCMLCKLMKVIRVTNKEKYVCKFILDHFFIIVWHMETSIYTCSIFCFPLKDAMKTFAIIDIQYVTG